MISREGILKINNTYAENSKNKRKENKFLTYRNVFMLVMSILNSFCIFFSYTLPFVFGFGAFIIYKKELNNLPLIIMTVLTAFTLNITSAFRLIIAFCFMLIVNQNYIVNENKSTYSVICALITLLSGFFVNYIFKNPPINNVYSLIESLSLILVFFVFNTSYNLIENFDLKKEFSSFEAISLSIIFSIIVLGLSDIKIFTVSIALIITSFMLLFVSTYFSLSLCLSFSLIGSILLTLKGGYSTDIILIFTVATLFSSMTKNLSRGISTLVFIFTTLTLSCYVNKSIMFTIPVIDVLIAGIIFLIVSTTFNQKILNLVNIKQKDFHGNIFNSAIKKAIKEEIENKKNMINEVSYNITLEEEEKNENITKSICKVLTADICTNCENFAKCWNEDGKETFVNFSQVILDTYNGKITSKKDLPKSFVNKCKYNFFIFKSASYLCDNLKIKKDYKNKLSKFKELMKIEFKSINKTLDNIYTNIKKGLNYFSKDEENIRESLFAMGIIVKESVVLEDFQGKMRIYIKTSKRLSSEEYRITVPLLLSEILDKNIMYDYDSFTESSLEAFEYTFTERMPFSLSVGIKRGKRNDKEKCGDNYSNIILPTNKHLIALADGMGTGEKANMQSERVLNLLEEMLGCESEEIDSINTINTILSLEEKEVFSTLDIILFDLFTAKAEFIKAGATESYLKREGEVTSLSAQALPIGIIENIDIAKETIKLKNNDYIYMVSDGFLEAFMNDRELIKEKILNMEYRNPQKIADELFNEAYARSLGKLKDDVSIIVVKVREELYE
ncbi:SpoIIE family protein phosphatase [Anaerofustis stercorihominis]|uniref:SpoIIE family protein phosphatase n=1 Tax=Anaerofustis stercorihominis TaxID=214853 RepID=UPI001485100A|nr:SpoIIE family protein phosphatase [Anaerofustis stercorihominis]